MPAATDPSAVAAAPAHVCRNCGAQTTGHYCANCGQETRVTLPTFGVFMREAAGRYVAFDGRMWRTLWALLARPGFLTLEYLNGRRRRYIRPARLFLVLYLLLFALIGILQSPVDVANQVVSVKVDDDDEKTGDQAAERDVGKSADKTASKRSGPDANKEVGKDAAKVAGNGPAGGAKQKASRDDNAKVLLDTGNNTRFSFDDDYNFTMRIAGKEVELPAELRKRFQHFKNLPREEKAEQIYAGFLRYGTYAMVALLPAFALLLKIAYLGRGNRYPGRPQRYAEHLVYSAHLHAFVALILMLAIVLPFGPVKAVSALWIVYYVMRARQTVYRGRWWAGLLRALVIVIFYSVLVALAMLGLLAAAVMLR